MALLSFVLSIYIILTVLKFLKKYTKEKEIYNNIENFEYVNNILAEHSNNPEAFRNLNQINKRQISGLLPAFLSHKETHRFLCLNFINMMKQNASNEDLGRVLIEMNIIREEYNTKVNIDKLLFPAIVEPEEAIKLFQVFQMQIQECELNRNIPKGYAYMAWSITLIAHINRELSSLGIMLWKELERGIKCYENESLKSWEKFPIF